MQSALEWDEALASSKQRRAYKRTAALSHTTCEERQRSDHHAS